MTCVHCGGQIPVGGRRDRLYCKPNCRKRAVETRAKTGATVPLRRRHPAFSSSSTVLQAAAGRAEAFAETNGWNVATLVRTLNGLTAVLDPGMDIPRV